MFVLNLVGEVVSRHLLLVLDYGDVKIKRFSSDGKFGEGPGELKNPTDFVIDKNYNVWVCDPANGLVTVFNENREVLGFKLVGTKWLATRLITMGDFLVEVYDMDGNFEFGLGRELLHEHKDVLLGGWIRMKNLNSEKVHYMNKTINEFPDPKVEIFSIEGKVVRGLLKDAPFSVSA